ncbi:MAG TPA: integron integrase [Anaerolineae bacterium]|nr:integron integrase [Anaerolineae bacterium]
MKLTVVRQQARDLLRAKHLADSTEKAYLGWIERYAAWLKSYPDQGGPASVEAFLTHLAVAEHVSASTQNQARSALLFLYRDVLRQDPGAIHAVRAKRGVRVPIALTHAEALRLINALRGDYQLLAQLMYGSGLRVMEALRLRVKDVNFARLQITVRDGKGDKDRFTILSPSLVEPLRAKLAERRALHRRDLAAGLGEAYLPDALARRYPNAPREFSWQFIFASPRLTTDPRDGKPRRHHILPTNVQRQIKRAAHTLGLDKRAPIGPHTLRHSFATRLVEKKAPIHEVKELMGHASIETTMIYLRAAEHSGHTVVSPLDT